MYFFFSIFFPFLVYSSSLHKAVSMGDVIGIQNMLETDGVDLEVVNQYNQTPLHLAASMLNAEILKILVSAGANVKAKDKYGDTPLHKLSLTNVLEPMETGVVLDTGGKKRLPFSLYQAYRQEYKEMVETLMSAGANVNERNGIGQTTLHRAAFNGSKVGVSVLMELGANVNAKDDKYQTPLHFAAEHRNPKIAEMLIASDAYMKAKDVHGKSPFDRAVFYGRMETARLLYPGANIKYNESWENKLYNTLK